MDTTMIKDAVILLKTVFDNGESIFLHEVLWTLDAKHHAILNTDELDAIVKKIGGLQKSCTQKGVELSRLESENSDFLTQDDIDKSMEIYLATFFPNWKY